MTKSFDVFLSHNSKDKLAVRELAEALRVRGLKVWLDEWELVPGQPWQEALEEVIETTGASAVLVGKDGLGPWQDQEMRGCLSEFVERKLPVIPVLLPGAPEVPRLPFFLKRFTWVDLRGGLTEDGIDRLQWGATGKRLDRSRLPSIPTAAPEMALAAAEAQQASAEVRPAPLEVEASATVAQEQSAQSLPVEPEATPVPPKVLPIAGVAGTVPASGENRSDFGATADEGVLAAGVRAQVERVLAATDWGSKHEGNRDSDAPGTEAVWAEFSIVPRALLVRSLLDLLSDVGSWKTEWQCLVLLRYAVKAAGGREHVPDVIAALIPYLRDRIGSVQEAAFRLLKEAPTPLRLKWETFLRAWPGSSRTASSWLCRPLVEYCPLTERGRTGAAIAEALENRLCYLNNAVWALKELDYRQGAGVLRAMLIEDVSDLVVSTSSADDIVYIASVLAEWGDRDAIPFIKEAIDLTHPRLAYRVCELLHCLLKIDGEASIPYAIELVVEYLEPSAQLHFLERGRGVSRCRITNLLPAIARLLGTKDIHQDVRTAVNEILAGASSGST